MKLTLSLELTLGLFMLCSAHHLRVFRLPGGADVNADVRWSAALGQCNQTGESFVTLYDEEDANFAKKFLSPLRVSPMKYWLGLRKGRNITWSDGKPVTFNDSSVNVTDGQQICVAIENSRWIGFSCSEKKPFMCTTKDSNFTLIQSNKTWCQALKHCRTHYRDLVSIHSKKHNDRAIDKGISSSFWIGLMYDEWEWMDNGCSSFREWPADNDPTESKDFTQVNFLVTPSAVLYPIGCNNIAHSFCSKGLMRIKVIKKLLKWEEAFKYCKDNHAGPLWIEDGEDQKAVEQWLQRIQVEGPLWIGMRQSRVFGFWIWSDRMVNYSNWRNEKQPEPSVANLCGVINMGNYTWSNENCLIPRQFLCEEEIVFVKKNTMGG